MGADSHPRQRTDPFDSPDDAVAWLSSEEGQAKLAEAQRTMRGIDLQHNATILRVAYKGRWRHRFGCDHGALAQWVLGRLDWPFQTRTCARCGRIEDVRYQEQR